MWGTLFALMIIINLFNLLFANRRFYDGEKFSRNDFEISIINHLIRLGTSCEMNFHIKEHPIESPLSAPSSSPDKLAFKHVLGLFLFIQLIEE